MASATGRLDRWRGLGRNVQRRPRWALGRLAEGNLGRSERNRFVRKKWKVRLPSVLDAPMLRRSTAAAAGQSASTERNPEPGRPLNGDRARAENAATHSSAWRQDPELGRGRTEATRFGSRARARTLHWCASEKSPTPPATPRRHNSQKNTLFRLLFASVFPLRWRRHGYLVSSWWCLPGASSAVWCNAEAGLCAPPLFFIFYFLVANVKKLGAPASFRKREHGWFRCCGRHCGLRQKTLPSQLDRFCAVNF